MEAALPGYLRPRVLLHPPGPGPAPGPGCAWDGGGRASRAHRWPPQSVARRWIQQRGGKAGHVDWQRRPMGASAEGAGLRDSPAPCSARARSEAGEGREEGRERDMERNTREGTGSERRSARSLWAPEQCRPRYSGARGGREGPPRGGHLRRCTERFARSESPQIAVSPSKLKRNKNSATSAHTLACSLCAAALGMQGKPRRRAGSPAPPLCCPRRCHLCPSSSPRIMRHS